MNTKNLHRFIRLTQITLVFVYLVILAGSVVRATGAGMGCPDWPKCFGQYIPPTDVSQLPENYKEIYAGEHGAVEEFNALKTWTEYINRLFGAILGILIFVQLIFSLVLLLLKKLNASIFILSFIEFILIGFQAWLGAKVVSSNLAPVKITTHMIAALVILSVALIIIEKAKRVQNNHASYSISPAIKYLSIAALVFTVVQLLLGTQVREEVDVFTKTLDTDMRGSIIDNLSLSFIIHRSFSIAIVLLNAFLIFKIYKNENKLVFKSFPALLGGFLLLEVAVGIILSYFALPPTFQPVHLMVSCIIYALQFHLILKAFRRA